MAPTNSACVARVFRRRGTPPLRSARVSTASREKMRASVAAGDSQPMLDVASHVVRLHGLHVKAQAHPLVDLRALPHAVAQLRLAEQDDVQVLVLPVLEVGEQADLLQQRRARELRLIHDEHGAPRVTVQLRAAAPPIASTSASLPRGGLARPEPRAPAARAAAPASPSGTAAAITSRAASRRAGRPAPGRASSCRSRSRP